MELSDIIQFLLLTLLIIVVIIMYVHLCNLIKNDGIAIKVIQQQMKESMSAAQRMGLAGLYVGKKDNMLMESDKRGKGDASKRAPLVMLGRGNEDVSHLMRKTTAVADGEVTATKSTAVEVAQSLDIPIVDAVQAGAASTSAIEGLKPSATIEDDSSMTVDPLQNGIIDTAAQETFVGPNSRVQPNAAFLVRSDGKSIFA